MLPGNSQILTCPYCGTEKEIMSLVSGNTFGSEIWSDNKRISPMLPEISYIQKCPRCKKYYIKERQKTVNSKNGYSNDKGLLTFPELKEAFLQFMQEEDLNKREEKLVRSMLHHGYNDYYYRSIQNHPLNEEDRQFFHDNGMWLIQNLITDNVLKAEFYREIEEFDKAREIIESIHTEDEFLDKVIHSIRVRLDMEECGVFQIE